MKKIILLIIFSISGIYSYAGEVFPKSDAIWNFRTSDDRAILIALIGDTIINDTIYQKMYAIQDTLLVNNSLNTHIGEIRENNKKVWLRTNIQNPTNNRLEAKEILLYDFNIKKGDKIFSPLYIINSFYPFILIPVIGEGWEGTVKSVTLDTQGRKHYLLDYEGVSQEEWIEGIGTTTEFKGIIKKEMVGEVLEYNKTYLQCFTHNGKIEYQYNHPDSRCQSCFCEYQYVQIQEEVSGKIKIYAVSEQKEIQLELPETSFPVQIKMYNLSGQLIYSYQIHEKYFSFGVQSVQSGTYIYRINRLGKQLQSGKIIIQ